MCKCITYIGYRRIEFSEVQVEKELAKGGFGIVYRVCPTPHLPFCLPVSSGFLLLGLAIHKRHLAVSQETPYFVFLGTIQQFNSGGKTIAHKSRR